MDPESRALQAQLANITSVLSGIDLHQIGNRLVADKFLGLAALSSILDTLGVSSFQKANRIMNIVITQVNQNTSRFPAFLEILRTDDTCSILVTKIMESYIKFGGKQKFGPSSENISNAGHTMSAAIPSEPQQLQEKCSVDLLLKISELGFDCKSVGRRLLSKNFKRIDEIFREESEERHRREKMLLEWWEMDDGATPQKLISVLQALKLNDTAAQVKALATECTKSNGGPPPGREQSQVTDLVSPDGDDDIRIEPDVTAMPCMVVSDGKKKTDAYKMKIKDGKHGVALIISNTKFINEDDDRSDAVVDETRVLEIFGILKYRVMMLKDLYADEIESALKFTTTKDSHLGNEGKLISLIKKGFDETKVVSKDDDSFVCCIMTHGSLKVVYGSDGEAFHIDKFYELLAPERCPNLTDKPKMFFIQACQGGAIPQPVMVKQDDITRRSSSEPAPLQVKSDTKDYKSITPTSDFIISYSAFPRQKAQRSIYEAQYQQSLGGTWYIKALHEVVVNQKCYKKDDLLSMITKVHKIVQEQECTIDKTIYKQCPYREDTLRYKVYFIS